MTNRNDEVEVRALVNRLADTLDPDLALIIRRRLLDDAPFDAIADELGKPASYVADLWREYIAMVRRVTTTS